MTEQTVAIVALIMFTCLQLQPQSGSIYQLYTEHSEEVMGW